MYNKLFTKILDSSVWLLPDPHRIVWFTFLAAMDEDSNVMFASSANVAARALVSREDAEAAIKAFESPDPDSGDPDHEGRRIERFPGGWHVLNGAKYRALVTKAIIREQTRVRVARHRERLAGNAPVTQAKRKANASVTPSEALAEALAVTPPTPPQAGGRFAEFWDAYPKTPRKVARAQCLRKWQQHRLDAIADRIIASVRDHCSSPDWVKDSGAYIPAPLVWLNQARWEAPVLECTARAGGGTGELERMKAERSAPMPADVAAKLAALAGKMRAQ